MQNKICQSRPSSGVGFRLAVIGITTSFFQLAAQEAPGEKVNVPQRAAELAELAAAYLGIPTGFERVEAVKGYLNLYFDSTDYARRVIGAVLQERQEVWLPPQAE